jgi:hypothetical protein
MKFIIGRYGTDKYEKSYSYEKVFTEVDWEDRKEAWKGAINVGNYSCCKLYLCFFKEGILKIEDEWEYDRIKPRPRVINPPKTFPEKAAGHYVEPKPLKVKTKSVYNDINFNFDDV